MSYKDSQDSVLEYIKLDSPETRRRVKKDLNDAIRRFMNWRYWKFSLYSEDLTLDGTGSYDLSNTGTILTYPFHRIKKIYIKADDSTTNQVSSQLTNEYSNVGLEQYNRASDKTRIYALERDTLYISGTSYDITIEYQSAGTGYPMSADADNPLILQEYTDIIEQWAKHLFLKWFGEDDSARAEKIDLNEMLRLEKGNEAIEEKRGRIVRISSHNRY